MIQLIKTTRIENAPLFRSNILDPIKPYCSVCGGFIIQTIVGGFLAIGNLIPYIASHLTYSNNITLIHSLNNCTSQIQSIYASNVSHCSWILTAAVIGYASFGPIGGKIHIYLSSMRWTIFIGGLMICIGILLTYYAINNVAYIIILYGFIFGAGTGIFWGPSIASSMKWWPHKRAFAGGTVIIGMGLGQMVFDFIETLYINRTNIKSTDCGFVFNAEIIEKVPTCFIVLSIFCLLCVLLAMLLSFEKPENNIDENGDNLSEHSLDYTASEAIKTYQFWLIFVNCFLNMILLCFVYSEWKIFCENYLQITNDYFLLKLGMTAACLNAIGRIFWGIFFDLNLSFSISMGTCTLLMTIFVATLPLCKMTQYKQTMAFIWINMLYILVGANYALIPPALSHTFGLKNIGVIIGFIAWSDIPSSIIESVIVDVTQNRWVVLCLIMASISALSFFVAMFYPKNKKKKIYPQPQNYVSLSPML